VGVECLKKGIGFPPYAFHERFVFHGVLARGLKLRPQALNARQVLVGVLYSGTGIHAPRVSGKIAKWKIGLLTTRRSEEPVHLSTHNH
jgi:hypothetical protein